MELKALDTVKQRAEGIPHSPLVTVFEIVAWLAALVTGILAAIRYVNHPEWKKSLAIGLLSAVVLLVLTFLYPPLWLRALFDVVLIGLIVWIDTKGKLERKLS
jgi:hypothetical protein